MTQQDKELLIKDLSARLPYGVILDTGNFVRSIDFLTGIVHGIGTDKNIEDIKYYLRPISSITEEESKYLASLKVHYGKDTFKWIYDNIDYLNSRHLDYRGLIDKGLVLKASKGMYNNYDNRRKSKSL